MNIPQKFWSVSIALFVILFVFVAAISLKTLREIGYVGVNTAMTSTINVDGTGHVFSIPDVATFTFTVNEKAKTVAEAQSKATTKINSSLKVVKDQGIVEKDISTQSYSINPEYEYQNASCPRGDTVTYCPPGKSVLVGYSVNQTIQVKIRDLAKAGSIFTAIGQTGVSGLNGLDFSVDDPETLKSEAREKAIANAKVKAEKLAKQLGVKLVKIISYSDNSGMSERGYVSYAYGKGGDMMSSVAPAPEVPTGESKITSNVSITYEIQ